MQLLLDGLLLDPNHVRYGQGDEVKSAVQRDAVECLTQLALHEPTRSALGQDAAVVDALRTLVDKAMTEEARRSAEGALMVLVPQEVHHHGVDPNSLHVMMSCTRNRSTNPHSLQIWLPWMRVLPKQTNGMCKPLCSALWQSCSVVATTYGWIWSG